MDTLGSLNFNLFGGYRIVENAAMTKDGDPIQVKRTWRERLLSRPWRPWVAERTVIPQVPDDQVIVLRETSQLVMHPELAQILRRTLRAEGRRIA